MAKSSNKKSVGKKPSKGKKSHPKKPAASKGPVRKDMTIGEVVQRYPEAAMIMMEKGLHCIGCHVNPFETIEQGAAVHGMPAKEIEAMVSDINRAVGKKK